jgi:hypothetical protein
VIQFKSGTNYNFPRKFQNKKEKGKQMPVIDISINSHSTTQQAHSSSANAQLTTATNNALHQNITTIVIIKDAFLESNRRLTKKHHRQTVFAYPIGKFKTDHFFRRRKPSQIVCTLDPKRIQHLDANKSLRFTSSQYRGTKIFEVKRQLGIK